MKTCDQYRELILDHLYGLLETSDTSDLSRHIDSCAACRAELSRAEKHKKLLGLAARTQISGFQFSRPVEVAVPARPRVFAFTSALRWAIAAGILLAIVGVGIPGAYYWRQQERVAQADLRFQLINQSAEQTYQGFRDRIARAESDSQSLQKQMQEEAETRQKKINQIWTDINTQRLNVTVTGPQTLEPGAPNPFRFVTTDLNGQPAPANLSVKVVNDKEEVLYKKENLRSAGNQEIPLPADLPVSPKSEMSLVVSVRGQQGAHGQLTEKIKLAAPVYVTHLATDKPMYQPGETVHFRSLTLDRFSLKPAEEDLQLVYTLTRPTGEKTDLLRGTTRLLHANDKSPFLGPDHQPMRGIGAGDYTIDPTSPGGEYTLTVSEANNRFPTQDRKFIVNRYEKPRLNKDLEFTAKAYGPGDSATAACKAARVEGGNPVAGQPVTATVNIDGVSYAPNGQPGGPQQLRTDATGGVSVKFKLPAVIQTGQATLSVTFQDQGVTEAMVRPIPIVLKKLNIEFFPEGGDLVAGTSNRVYFQARTTLDKPAELKGRIVDDSGKEVAAVETFNDPAHPEANQGMGQFSFVPQIGKQYQLKIDNPLGIEGRHALPPVKAEGVVMSIANGVSDDPISIKIQSPDKDRSLVVGAYCRGRLLAHQSVEVKKSESKDLKLSPATDAGGVVRVTVFEKTAGEADRNQPTPRAERLIYRASKEHLNLEIKCDRENYVPGDRVKVVIKGTDEKNEPRPGIVMIAVVDKSVLKLADEKTYRSMPAHVLLTSEIRRPEDLEHADFLLGKGPSAAKALDLLLGTQGWRRFAEQDPAKFQKERGEDAQRLLVLNGQFRMQSVDYAQHETQEVENAFQTQWSQLQNRLTHTNQELAQARSGDTAKEELSRLKADSEKVSADFRTATGALGEYKDFLQTSYLPGARIALLIVAGICLVVGLARRASPQAIRFYAVATSCLLLFLVLTGVPRNILERDQLARNGISKNLAASDKLPPADRFAHFDKELKEMERDIQLGAVAPEERMEGMMGGAGGAAPLGRKAGGGGVNEEQLQDRAMRRFAIPGGVAQPEAAKPGTPPPPPPNLQFGMQPAQALNRNQEFMFKKRDLKLGEADKAKDMPGLAQFQFQGGRENQKAEKEALARPLQGVEKDKRGLVEEGKAIGGPAAGIERMRAGAGMHAGAPAAPQADFRKAMGGGMMARMAAANQQPAPEPLVVREYAHLHTHGESNIRSDFAETLFWQPALILPDGQAEISFELCDSVTTFQVLASGHTLDGRIAEATAELTSRKPLVLQPKLPIEITAGDKIDVPLSIANNTNNQQSVQVRVQSAELKLIGGKDAESLTLHPEERTRRVFHFQPGIIDGEAKLRFSGETEPASRIAEGRPAPGVDDSIESSIKVVPQGFPIVGSQSDLLEGSARNDVVLPETWIPGTLKYQVAFYPSTLADLQKGLEAMLREPGGCFEQTSTSNYPNLLVLNYLKETDQAKPEVARRAQELLGRGYQMLTSFECLNSGKNLKEGYEWFGGAAPAHEALTAYGLMEFRDMAKVYDVDKAMLERTQKYLMSQKDGKGGFKRNPRALDTFGRAPDNITNAYIVWALTESGQEDDVTKELSALMDQAKTSKDPYFLALVAHSLINRGRQDDGVGLLKKVAEVQQPDGHLDAVETSITGSGGRDLQIETTALVLHGWLKAKRPEIFNKNIQSAVKWVGQQRGGFGGFGSTQSTILALKALIAYAKANKKTAEAGDLIVFLADKEIARKQFPAGAEEAVTLELKDAERLLKPGKNSLRVEVSGKNAFPYTATWSYRSLKPVSADACLVQLATHLDRETATEGETVRLSVQVQNKSGKGQGMTVAVVGLPAGLTLPEDMKQLKDMARLRNNGTEVAQRGEIDAWETRGRELVLYWRDLAPDKKIDVHVQLICRVPGEYQGPASRAYLYYNADTKCWVEPMKIAITPKEEK